MEITGEMGCAADGDKTEPRFKTGDIAVLNSGGPRMTVTTVQNMSNGGRRVSVSWSNEVNNIQEHSFPEACLRGPGHKTEKKKTG